MDENIKEGASTQSNSPSPSRGSEEGVRSGYASTLKSRAARGFLWGLLNNGTVQVLGALFGILILQRLDPSAQAR